GPRSGAVPAEHPALVLQLAPVLHEVAVLAYELGGLWWDHLDGQRLETLLALHGEHGVVLLLLRAGLPILLLGDQLLEARLHLAALSLAVPRGGGGTLLLLGVLVFGLFEVLGLIDLFVFHPSCLSKVGGLYSGE